LITNFDGLGNGILLLPILKQLELVLEDFFYFHTYNPIFEMPVLTTEVDLSNYLGSVPALWRRFDTHNWDSIGAFLEQEKINLLINLRDQDPPGTRPNAGIRGSPNSLSARDHGMR
jgi:hypothetical protein